MVKQLSFFDSEPKQGSKSPSFEQMRYIARQLNVWMPNKDRPKEREGHLARLLKAVKREVDKREKAIRKNFLEPYILPEILLFWVLYGEQKAGG